MKSLELQFVVNRTTEKQSKVFLGVKAEILTVNTGQQLCLDFSVYSWVK